MKRILAITTSLTGNTETFLDYVNERDDVLLFHYDIKEISSFDEGTLAKMFATYDGIILGTYTWGNGVVPPDMRMFLLKMKNVIPKRKLLIFGSGITLYKFFCGAVDKAEKMIKPREEKVPKIKFELTFEPEEHEEAIKLFDKYVENL